MTSTLPRLSTRSTSPTTSGHDAELLDVTDPATGEVIDTIPAGSAEAAAQAVTAAAAAFAGWSRTAPAQRAGRLKAGAARVAAAIEELAELQTREGGKPIGDSRGGVEAGVGALQQYAELGPLHRGRSLAGGWDATDLMVHEPYGVVAVLTPWNDPVAIVCGLLGAALVTGNTVVLKPSERTPLSAVRLAELLDLPTGVLTVLLGDARAGRPLVADPRVGLVLHVGSSATGREIAAATAVTGAVAVLEGGGKDPLVIDADVDPVWAAGQCALGAFANAGQICTSVERVYVHADIAEAFLAALVTEAESRRVGNGLDADTTMGPLIDNRQRDVVDGHVQAAVAAGAQVLTGGVVPAGAGAFYPPTVLTGVTEDMSVMTEETFGPVAAVAVVPDFDTGLLAAARSDYGLAATVLTRNPDHAQRAWRELPVGTVKINAVFGGAPGGSAEPRAGSGRGVGYGPELLDTVTRLKAVHLGLAPAPAS